MGSCRVDIDIPQDQENVVRIIVEFQIQCGFKFDFVLFLCGVQVPGWRA